MKDKMTANKKSLRSNLRPGNLIRVCVGVLVIYLSMAGSTNVFADDIEPRYFYELSNKEISKRHFSFLIQGSWGKTNAAHSWEDKRSDPQYNRKAAQWMFVPVIGGKPDEYWIVNRETGGYLAQTNTNKWDVDVAGKGAHGSVWTVVLNREGTHYKFINKASGFGLFQADWGNKWDAHVWKDNPDHDAYLWHAELVVDDPPAELIKPNSVYRISNKELSKRHDGFLIQGNYGVPGHRFSNGAQSWMEFPGDRDYRISAYEWKFVPVTGGGPKEYWIVNRATGGYLAQTDTNAWDVDVAGKGAHGSVWTVELNKEKSHYKIINKASGFGLFQADWGYEWDAHTWDKNPDHDAYLWKIQTPSTIPTVTILSVKCIHPSTGIDGWTKALFQAVDMAVQIGAAAATGGGSAGASLFTKEGMKAFVKSKLTKQAIKKSLAEATTKEALKKSAAEAAAKAAALKAGNAATGQSADSFSELIFTKVYGESPDDLVVYVNGLKRWPDVKSKDIKSQQTIKLDLNIPYDPRQGFVIELKDYDSGSADDSIGWKYWSPEAIRALPDGYSKVFFESRSEGSLYVVEILVGEGFD